MADDNITSEQSAVKQWLRKIASAKERWEPDFKRMRENSEFATGIQWTAQKEIIEERYIANITLQMIRHKVAYLYARNPEVEIERRPRMEFALWDGQIESLQEAYQGVVASIQTGLPDLYSQAVMQDFMRGRKIEEEIKRVCETLKNLHSYQVDTSQPEFKEMMKQLVTRTVTCGVGYCRVHFVRANESPLSEVDNGTTAVDRTKIAAAIANRVVTDGLDSDAPEMEDLKSLGLSLGLTDKGGMAERLEFDFPPATHIIPDERCRALKEFVAARWLAQEYEITLDEVNSIFGLEIQGADVKPEQKPSEMSVTANDEVKQKYQRVYEVMDKVTNTSFFVMEGYKDYLKMPEPFDPTLSGFWPIFALTFNDIEVESNTKASIFPPSDVDLIRHAQLEWNRTRDALRAQRNANAPTYLTRAGLLSDTDKENLRNREPNQIVELNGLPADMEPNKAVQILQVAAIDANVYDTAPLEQDIQHGVGMQQSNLGPAQPNVTATVGSIAEQSRETVSSSNVDDLDGFLTRLAKACIEIELKAFSEETVKEIVGPGAVWPMENREAYLNMINIKVKAASSGRPNKALEISNYTQIAPQLLQAGANPVAVIEEGIRRLDDRLDVTKFFPLPGMSQQTMSPSSPQHPVDTTANPQISPVPMQA